VSDVSRRRLLTGGLGVSAAAALAACDHLVENRSPAAAPGAAGTEGPSGRDTTSPTSVTADAAPGSDGSWRDSGPQPHQPKIEKLKAGDTPPQFVVISWDGAGESVKNPLLARFRGISQELGASMTLFLSGLYFVPNSKRTLYTPPGRPAGSSAIPFLSDESVHATIDGIGKAWLEGHEIGTHFNGHFCGKGGVSSWTPDQWKDEIAQAKGFVEHWRTNTGFTDLEPLPFDYEKELIGGRTPCLEGSENLRTAANDLGWRYDTSSNGIQMWPSKAGKLWALDLQSIPFVGHKGQVMSMDYNMMYNQSKVPDGDSSKFAQWQQEAVDSYLAGFKRAYDGNRAPLIIGNHFESWNGGIYMTAVEQVMRKVATYPDARLVSFRQLCDYLDAQDPAVLTQLRTLQTGSAPKNGWKTFLT
jgi:hypothetical protein